LRSGMPFQTREIMKQKKVRVFDVRKFGAVADGKTNCTKAIQTAIDQASAAGGGTVVLSKGKFLSGTLELKSDVTLKIAKPATLLGSTSILDYHRISRWPALILANKAQNITISGQGQIDGQGPLVVADTIKQIQAGVIEGIVSPKSGYPGEDYRPELIELFSCHNVRVADVTLRNAACWVQTYADCDGVKIERVKVRSTCCWNNDGIDIVDSRNVLIAGCDIDSADDGICLKSENASLACEDVTVRHCRVRTSASGVKLGTASFGGFKRIKVSDISVYDTYRSAAAIECVDGGVLEDIFISDIKARNTGNAIFIRLGHRNKTDNVSQLRNVVIQNMQVETPAGRPDAGYEHEGPPVLEPHNLIPSSITGIPGQLVQGIVLKNIVLTYGGGAKPKAAQIKLDALESVPERAGRYPEFSMFGELPAWGLYCRHINGLKIENLTMRLKGKDFRPAVVCDDVDGLTIAGLGTTAVKGAPDIVFKAPATKCCE
jgi:polygalacturonase